MSIDKASIRLVVLTSLIMLVSPWVAISQTTGEYSARAARDDSQQQAIHWVLIESNQSASNIFADTTWIGTVNSGVLPLPLGASQVILVPESPDYWSVAPVVSEIGDIAEGDTLKLRMDFPYYYSMESIPSGAVVELDTGFGREIIGETPLVYTSEQPVAGDFKVAKTGYRERIVAPGRELWNRQLISLQNESELYLGGSEASTEAPKARKKWIDYLAASAVIIGGALAVHYKTEANTLYSEYTETGDPALRSEIERLDTQSAIALGTMQVGFTVVVFRLAF